MRPIRPNRTPTAPVAPGRPIASQTEVPVPAGALSSPQEVRLLAGRLGGRATLRLGCIATPEANKETCLGAPLGPPLSSALITEWISGGVITAVSAEESLPGPNQDEAERRLQALTARIEAAQGAPRERAPLLWEIEGHVLSLERTATSGGGSAIYLMLKRREVTTPAPSPRPRR